MLLIILGVIIFIAAFSLKNSNTQFSHTCGYNNFNPGLGIQSDYLGIEDTRIIAGGYYNSFYRSSFYGGLSYQPLHYGIVKFGVAGGVVTNYSNLKIPVMALPMISIEGEQIGLDIMGGPTIGSSRGLVTVNFKFKL